MALADDLVSWWTLDESSGARADSHGSNTLADNNTVGSATGVISNGGDFEVSSSEYLSITDASQSGLDGHSAMSFSFWINPESLLAGRYSDYVVSKYLTTGNHRAYAVHVRTFDSNKIYFTASSDGTSASGSFKEWKSNGSVGTGSLYHVVVTCDLATETTEMWINGTSQTVSVNSGTSIGSSFHNGTGDFLISGRSGGLQTFDGIIDEVAVWSRAITSSEVAELYNSGDGITYSDLATGTDYPITAAVGAFTLSGTTTAFSVAKTIVANSISFAITGVSATFASGKGMVADAATFALTGISATLGTAVSMVAAAASFTLTGIDTIFSDTKMLVADAVSYTFTGENAVLRPSNIWSNVSKSVTSWTNSSKS